MPLEILDPDEATELAAVTIHKRNVSEEQLRRFESYAAEMFTAFGMDINTASTRDTPRPDGYEGDPKLLTAFPTECRGGADCRLSQVIEGPISFFSLCEHHGMPFHGQAYLGYIAHEHIIGISKLTRLVRVYARRFTVQERVGQQIADTLEAMLEPHGVAVYLVAHHLCTQMRGVREISPVTRTTFWRGNYDSDPSLRSEFFKACGLN
jgi:GTP cyclohydrolase I